MCYVRLPPRPAQLPAHRIAGSSSVWGAVVGPSQRGPSAVQRSRSMHMRRTVCARSQAWYTMKSVWLRHYLVALFRSIIAETDRPGIVVEGRDITTVVAPDAAV